MNFDQMRTSQTNLWIIVHLRYLLGLAFFPSGITKLIGHRFTQISTDSPIGYFFEALYQSGFYWNFLGLAQLVAGILLMTQRFALLGALAFYAILTNVWLITISLSFKGTWIITSLMMIAVLILLIWDYKKLLPLVSFPEADKIWIISGIVYSCSFIILSLINPFQDGTSKILVGILVAIIILTFVISNYFYFRNRKLLSKS